MTRVGVFVPRDIEDFKKMLNRNANATTHVCVTDEATYLYVVPVVTSENRHYIVAPPDWPEEKIRKAVEICRSRSIDVIHGEFYLMDGTALQMLLQKLRGGITA